MQLREAMGSILGIQREHRHDLFWSIAQAKFLGKAMPLSDLPQLKIRPLVQYPKTVADPDLKIFLSRV